MCCPKHFGSIGMRQLKSTNSALLMRGLWNFHTASTLPWVQLIREKHYKRYPLSMGSRIPAGCSPLWKTLLKIAPPFFTSISYLTTNGNDTPFWHARWCSESTLQASFPHLYAAARLKHVSVKTWLAKYARRLRHGFVSPLIEEGQNEI